MKSRPTVCQLRVYKVPMEDPLPIHQRSLQGKKLNPLEDILLQLGPITRVSYEPSQGEHRQAARALLPTFPQKPAAVCFIMSTFVKRGAAGRDSIRKM